MIRGIYTAASGMVSNFRRQSIVTNNLANVSTTGYKQDVTASSDFSNMLMIKEAAAARPSSKPWESIGTLGAGTELGEIQLDQSQGDLAETGNALDLALNGPGYFAIQTPAGTYYTRDGSFYRDPTGLLARADGGLLLGENGPIQVGEGNIVVDGDGTVSVDGQVAGRIRTVEFGPQDRLLKIGSNYVAPENANVQPQAAQGTAISQGFLERSNVDVTRAMVEMMSAMRSYEASQRMVQLQDQTLDRAVNDVGKV